MLERCTCGAAPEIIWEADNRINLYLGRSKIVCPKCGRSSLSFGDFFVTHDSVSEAEVNWNNMIIHLNIDDD